MPRPRFVLHYRLFKSLIENAERDDGSGDEQAYDILHAALWAAKARLGGDNIREEISTLLSHDAFGA